MSEPRYGRQTPTHSVVFPYTDSKGQEAVDLYNSGGNQAMEWQVLQAFDILAYNENGLWTHPKYGLEVSRRNGKTEIFMIREAWGLKNGEKILHTAHRSDTAHDTWERLMDLLPKIGLNIENSYRALGREYIVVEGGGKIDFRTRTSKSGLGTGYDLLVIDEAQEYTTDQESALRYVVTGRQNPQTILCGTPPTVTSSGTVFQNLRKKVFSGESEETGWAEWSVDQQHSVRDVDAWYETNPSLGYFITERDIKQEITGDDLDFNIQRLGYWISYNLKSAISLEEWKQLQAESLPELKGKLHCGIKYSSDGSSVAMAIACKTRDDKIFVESIDCQNTRNGNNWILKFLKEAELQTIVIDGKGGQSLLEEEMNKAKIKKKPIFPKVKEVVTAFAGFEQAIFSQTLVHMGQPSLEQSASNCEKRPIAGGGFGYSSIKEGVDVTLLESVALAHWACSSIKEVHRQRIFY